MRKKGFANVLAIVAVLTIIGVFLGCSQPAAPTPVPTQAPKPAAPAAATPAPAAPAAATPAPAPTKPAAEAPKPTAPAAPAAAAKPAGTSIKVGFLAPMSGILGDFGPRNRIAVDMAVKEINAAGGINGVPLQVIEGDTKSDEQEVLKLTQKFTSDDKVLALIGFFESPGVSVAFPWAKRLAIPAITQSPPMAGVLQDSAPWGFTFNLPDSMLIPPAVSAWVKKYNVKKAGVISATDQGYLKDLGEQLAAEMKKNGVQVADLIPIKMGDTDYSAAVTRLKGQSVEGVAVSQMAHRTGPMIMEMHRQGVNIPVVGSTTLAESGLIVTGGKDVEGVITGAAFWEDNPDPFQVKWAQAFLARSKVETPNLPMPDAFTSMHYDMVRALAQIMKDKGITNKPEDLAKDREKIRDGFQALKDFQIVGGKLTMGQYGQAQREVFTLIVQNGKFQKVAN